jgi:Ca-activated chloride channel family protein
MRVRAAALSCSIVALVASAVLLGAPGAQAPQNRQTPQEPSFRANIDVVSLNVTVTEAALGTPRYITNLDQSDFEVYEDGVKQDISVFNKTNSPIALSLLLDSSASMERKMTTAQEAAIGFVRKLRDQDMAEVIDFDDRSVVLEGFTNDVQKLDHAIRQTSAGGPTALFQALYVAMSEFKKLKRTETADEQPHRQAVVVLTDGQDTKSLFTFDDILDIVKRSETAVYTIGLRDGDDSSTKGFKEGEFYLRQFAQQTGGRSFFPAQLSDLASVYGEISDELSSQYTLGYTSKNTRRDGAWRRVVVRVARPGTVARTKQGYFAVKG